VFIGPYSPVAMGDYIAGPSHVLPTAGTARWGSPLGVPDFMRRVSWVELDGTGTKAAAGPIGQTCSGQPDDALAAAASIMARNEGFYGHALSIAAMGYKGSGSAPANPPAMVLDETRR